MSNEVYVGKHPDIDTGHFSKDEKEIIDVFASEFYVTNGATIRLGAKSEYKYILVKPTSVYGDMFNLDREVAVLLSRYNKLEPRALEAFDLIQKNQPAHRVEKICNVLVCKDQNVEESLASILSGESESQVVIPFSYDELLETKSDAFFFRNRFRKYFYSRDLFAFEGPLKKDLYFFGRTDLIHEVVNRIKSHENSGLFGLRKTGKTSLINGIERYLSEEKIPSLYVDCQDTSFNQRRWMKAVHYICTQAVNKFELDINIPDEDKFTADDASVLLRSFLVQFREKMGRPLILIFDEIENISPKTASAPHWQHKDFLHFWQTLRSIYQSNPEFISYVIVGTNPTCIEDSRYGTVDNPLFNHFKPIYIPGFEIKDTREMIRKLGRRMGLKFDETIYSRLTEDYGGHPFLMRHVCSLIAKEVNDQNRPIDINKINYSRGQELFYRDGTSYFDMILDVLSSHYPEEYDMLNYLANEDYTAFQEFAEMHPAFTAHLIGYGLINKYDNGYCFKIDAVKKFLLMKNKYSKALKSSEERWREISERRNAVERKLRKAVMLGMKIYFGETEAKDKVLQVFGGRRLANLSGLAYVELFDPTKSEIYFKDLGKIISKNWDVFKNTFSQTKSDMFNRLEFINTSRGDAHAGDISEEQFLYFRLCMKAIEDDVNDW